MASLFSTAGVSFSTAKAFKSGSKYWYLRLVADYAAAAASPADDFTAGPGRVGLVLTPSISKTEIEWEDGDKQTTNTSQSWEASIKTAQKDKGTIYGFFNAADGIVTQCLAEMTPTAVAPSSTRQYVTFMGLMTDPPAVGSKTEPELKFALGASTATVTINLASAYVVGTAAGTVFPNFGATTGTVSHASGDFYGMSEV
jgi:hypothetical protein